MASQNQTASTRTSNLPIILFTVLLTIALLALGAFGFWYFQQKIGLKTQVLPKSSPKSSVLPSLSPSASPIISPVPSLAPSPQGVSDLNLIKQALASKHNKSVSETQAEINKQTNPYASGVVKFNGEIGGAMWLAYKNGNQWIIVWDGNGVIPCATIQPYNFSVNMVPECWDENSQQSIHRH